MAEPVTRTRPVEPREKRAAAQLLAQRRYEKRLPPAPEVDAALRALQGPPSPEQIAQISMELARTSGVPAAVEFETYAKNLVIERARAEDQQRLLNEVKSEDRQGALRQQENQRLASEVVRDDRVATARAEDQQRLLNEERVRSAGQGYAQGRPPSAPVQQALRSFSSPPTEEQIRARAAELSRASPALGAEFESYARGLVGERAARQEGQLSPEQAAQQEAPRPAQPAPAPPWGGAPRQGTTSPAGTPPPKAETSLLQDAKDVLQGFGHVVTLGAVEAPEFIKRGAKKIRWPGEKEEQAKNDGNSR